MTTIQAGLPMPVRNSLHLVLPREWLLSVISGLAAFILCDAVGLTAATAAAGGLLALCCSLIGLVDWRLMLIPDAVSLPLIPTGLLASGSALHAGAAHLVPLDFWLGAVAAPLILASVNEVYRLLRGVRGIGLGDVKLAAATGAWVGMTHVAVTVLVAAIMALTVVAIGRAAQAGTVRRLVPFGTFLAPATFAVWFWIQF
jgi:leader peptidase (prepilin peptidase) / N-methyltransferase